MKKSILLFVFSCFVTSLFAVEITADFSGTNEAFWEFVRSKVYNHRDGRSTLDVDIKSNVTINDPFIVPDNTTIVVWSDDENEASLDCGSGGYVLGHNSKIIVVTKDNIYKVENKDRNNTLSYSTFSDVAPEHKGWFDFHRDDDKDWFDKFNKLKEVLKNHNWNEWRNWIDATAEEIAELAAFLPITLSEFTAENDGDYVLVEWTTSSEIDNDYFVVQYSLDGKDWNDVEQVVGVGTTSVEHNYQVQIDKNDIGTAPVLYFRLQQFDFDGNYTYSDIISLMVNVGDFQNGIYYQKGWIMYKGEKLRI